MEIDAIVQMVDYSTEKLEFLDIMCSHGRL